VVDALGGAAPGPGCDQRGEIGRKRRGMAGIENGPGVRAAKIGHEQAGEAGRTALVRGERGGHRAAAAAPEVEHAPGGGIVAGTIGTIQRKSEGIGAGNDAKETAGSGEDREIGHLRPPASGADCTMMPRIPRISPCSL
jgi:hypothetical protein